MESLETPTIDALPPYSPPASRSRDPETASIHSAAPSYYSEPPAYEYVASSTPAPNAGGSSARSNGQEPRQGLPRMHYAPGFIPRPSNPFCSSNYNFVSWSTVQRNPRRKQYENVARRRVQQNELMDTLVVTVAQLIAPPQPGNAQVSGEVKNETSPDTGAMSGPQSVPIIRTTTSLLDISTPISQPAVTAPSRTSTPTAITASATTNTTHTSNTSNNVATAPIPAPVHPHEDPDLVGHEAAERTRSQRLYREMMLRDPGRAMAQESLGWDFMLSQSADWEDRQRKWRQYRQWGWKGRLAHLGSGRF